MKRTERLFAIAEVLRGRRTGITAQELAERFEVTVRTIYRDLDSLRMANLPLHAEQGRGGGYALSRHYNLPPVNFTAREALVLLTAGELLIRHRWIPLTETLQAGLDKVRAALPGSSQRELERLQASLSFVGVPALPVDDAVRQVVERAWLEQRPLRIVYDGAKGETTRRVAIRVVVMERTKTLLNCDDLDKGEARQFLLHRIRSAELVATGSAPRGSAG